MLLRSISCALLLLPSIWTQSPFDDGRHSMVTYPIVEEAPEGGVEVTRLEYSRAEAQPMAFDLYRPEERGSTPLPVVVMVAATRTGNVLQRPQYVSWARRVAAEGMAAIVYESAWSTYVADFDHLLQDLHGRGVEQGIDPTRIGALACSGNVSGLYERIVARENKVRCAALYYGAPRAYLSPGTVDLLVVTAGRDDVELNHRIQELVAQAQKEGRNVDHIFHAQGHHAFDILDETVHSRAILDRTLAFWKTSLAMPSMQGTGSVARRALAHYSAEEWAEAMKAYGEYVEVEPRDPNGWFRRGVAASHLEEYLSAAECFERCAQLEFRPHLAYYDAACMCALGGEPARALDLLAGALDAGYRNWDQLDNDADLEAVRRLPAYQELMAAFR